MIFFINPLSAAAVSLSKTRLNPAAGETIEAFAMNKLFALMSAILLHSFTSFAAAGDWITAPSYYTHDPNSGERVTQYSPIGPFYTYPEASFVRSGYRNTRSSLQVGTSADHYHTTEQWGAPVQPYGEWQFPFRPYSVPYDAWGPQLYGGYPFGGVPFGAGPGYGGAGYPGGGFPGGGFPGGGFFPPGPGGPPLPGSITSPNPLQPGYSGQQQLLDGRYPPFDQLGPFERKQLFDYLYPPRSGAVP
jgi:hypothetical protein